MSGTPSSENSVAKPKAISSLAKKPSDVTRQGTQKLKFVPTLPARRKKEDTKPEPQPESVTPSVSTSDSGRGRGRGRGSGSNEGRGRGRSAVDMTASGPFALGPALAGSSTATRRAVPKSNFTPIVAPSKGGHTSLGAGLTNTAAPTIKSESGKGKEKAGEDDEVYSDPDEGVEILDMEHVRNVDYMAPDILKQEKQVPRIKKEDPDHGVDLANALDLSENEEGEDLKDIIEDFNQHADSNEDPSLRQDRLYFFQFPSPFPTFESQPSLNDSNAEPSTSNPTPKKVSFAPDVKPEQIDTSEQRKDSERSVDGVIGRLEVYKSGAVKMRLASGILLDVTASTQPSFLQHAVSIDSGESRILVLGEINKHFTISPDVDSLLTAMEAATRAPVLEDPESQNR